MASTNPAAEENLSFKWRRPWIVSYFAMCAITIFLALLAEYINYRLFRIGPYSPSFWWQGVRLWAIVLVVGGGLAWACKSIPSAFRTLCILTMVAWGGCCALSGWQINSYFGEKRERTAMRERAIKERQEAEIKQLEALNAKNKEAMSEWKQKALNASTPEEAQALSKEALQMVDKNIEKLPSGYTRDQMQAQMKFLSEYREGGLLYREKQTRFLGNGTDDWFFKALVSREALVEKQREVSQLIQAANERIESGEALLAKATRMYDTKDYSAGLGPQALEIVKNSLGAQMPKIRPIRETEIHIYTSMAEVYKLVDAHWAEMKKQTDGTYLCENPAVQAELEEQFSRIRQNAEHQEELFRDMLK